MRQRFAENASLEDLYKLIEKAKKEAHTNVWFALSSFETAYSRAADDSLYIKSFFLDIDVGKEKNSYATRDEAQDAVISWVEKMGLPEPTVVDSGNGFHVYWILKEEIPTKEWLPYAQKLKQLCVDHGLVIDPAVPADRARILRVPGTYNYGKNCDAVDPPLAEVITDINLYSLDEIVSCLGEVAKPVAEFDLAQVKRGLDEDTKKLLGYDDYEFEFRELAEKSLAGNGCNQIRWIIENTATCQEPMWYAGISVAIRCVDADTAIHLLSEGHPKYTPEETERKAQQSLAEARWAHGCEAFEGLNPGGCDGCPYKGKVRSNSPIGIVARLKLAEPSPDDPAEPTDTEEKGSEAIPKEFLKFPPDLFPFMRPANGGIYFQPAPDKNGIQQAPYQVYPYDIVPIKRLTSPFEGESLQLMIRLPQDGDTQHILPLRYLGMPDKYKEFLYSNGIMVNDKGVALLKEYFMKWASHFIHRRKAENMRIQMGWTSASYESFVSGGIEITPKGDFECPVSPSLRNVSPHIRPNGTYGGWRTAAEEFLRPGFEIHRLSLLAGFGSILVPMTNIGGLVMSLSGEKGSGKTGALQAGLSVFGDPIKQKITTQDGATSNGIYQRATTLRNLLVGIDETSNFKPQVISDAVFKLPMNEQPKIRLQTSYNLERKVSDGSSQLVLMTTNQSNRQKLFATGKANPEGELRRLLEFHIKKPPGLTESEGQHLFNPFKEHFGHAGPMFVKALYEYNIDNAKKTVTNWKLRILKDFVDDTGYSYWTGGLAAIFAAGEIAIKYKILDYDLEEIYQFVLKELWDMHYQERRTKKSYEDIINEYIANNMNSILMISNGKVVMEPRGDKLLIRVEVDTGRVFVSSSAMREHLEKLQINIPGFEGELLHKGVLNKGRVKRKDGTTEMVSPYKLRFGAGWKFNVSNIHGYEFKLDVSDLFEEDLSCG